MNVNEDYRRWIRERSCTVAGAYNPQKPERRDCDFYPWRSGMECAHVKTRGSGGVDVGNIVPLCPAHHDEQEGRIAWFEQRYSVNLRAVASALAARWKEEHGE